MEQDNASNFLSHAERLSELGCFEWNFEQNKIEWSDGLYHIFGLEPQQFEATFEAFLERVLPEDREQVKQAVEQAVTSGETFKSVERILHSTGEIRYLESRGEVLKDDEGKPKSLIGVCRDVTVTKNLETQLRESQKMEAVGRLAAGIAHDFNNLLTVVSVNADLLLLPKASSREVAVKYTQAISDAAHRARNLTSQLLMFSRTIVPNEKVLCLNEHLRSSAELFQSLLGDRIRYVTELRPELPFIRVDQSHLDQALVNLTVNARDAMSDGGELTVRTNLETVADRCSVAPGEYVSLEFSDTGVGVSQDDADHLFEPFFTTKPGGTGLGLAVIFGVVKEWGGSVQIQSRSEGGTTARILIPVTEKPSDNPKKQGEQPAEAGTERILVVDDQSQVRAATSYALRRSGYEVVEAQDAEQALRIARAQGGVDLLLTDVVMPGLTGPQLANEIRAEFPQAKVLFVSGYEDTRLRIDSAHLQKPYSINELLRNVRTILDQP